MAPRTTDRLTDLVVRKAKSPGWYADGRGLYLRIDDVGGKRWIFVFQWAGKRREMGLGPLADVSLAEARDEVDKRRKNVRAGIDPIEQRRREREEAEAPKGMTFADFAREVAPDIAPKPPKTHKVWVGQMTEKVGDLAKRPVSEVTTDDVLKAIKPYWTSRPETADKIRRRIEGVLDAAKAKGHLPETWQNPARWKGHLSALLPKRERNVKHHAALPYPKAPAFMRDLELRAQLRSSALALKFTVLTVVRSSEARGVRVGEIDRSNKLWTIPAQRMKKVGGHRREHVVPLSAAVMAIIDQAWPEKAKADDLLFWSLPRRKVADPVSARQPLSENALQDVLDDMDLKGVATTHGFRSTFKDWASNETSYPDELSEEALAHAVGNRTRRAYRRGDAIDRRRELMEAWAAYLAVK